MIQIWLQQNIAGSNRVNWKINMYERSHSNSTSTFILCKWLINLCGAEDFIFSYDIITNENRLPSEYHLNTCCNNCWW